MLEYGKKYRAHISRYAACRTYLRVAKADKCISSYDINPFVPFLRVSRTTSSRAWIRKSIKITPPG